MTVLVVEDNPISSKVFEHILDKHGYETLTAHDGGQALELLESHAEIELIITDIMMPNTNGIELVRKIKDRSEWSEIPILVCTSINPYDLVNSIPMQGWKYLFKPIRADKVIENVKEAFAQQRSALQNPDRTMSQIGMDPHAFREILDEFMKLVNDKITQLDRSSNRAFEESLELQDLLEGARLLRAERVIDILDKLNRCPAGEKSEVIRSTYPWLLRELKAVQHYLTIYTS
jgi:CheY-like chemotaxis protein